MTMTEATRYPGDVFEYPDEIADTFITIIDRFEDIEDADDFKAKLTDGIYYVRTCAENHYNFDYFRILYNAMAKLAENASSIVGLIYDTEDIKI